VDVAIHHDRVARSSPFPKAEISLSTDESASRLERIRAFRMLVQRLPEKGRVTFLLHEVHGLSSAEIARIGGTSVFMARARLIFARRELARMLLKEPGLVEYAKTFEEGMGAQEPRGSTK
jgi:RNA polymerase sigma-70 factor (ECF subfamily)